jgi:hypothetical protein
VNLPSNVPRSENSRRAAFAIGLCLVVVFKLWLVHTEEIYGSATEFDALWYLNGAPNTVGPHSPGHRLIRCSWLSFTFAGSAEDRYRTYAGGGYLALVAGLRKAGVPRSACLASYAVMVLHPGVSSRTTTQWRIASIPLFYHWFDGFEKMVDKVAQIEKKLGIYELAQFTPKM